MHKNEHSPYEPGELEAIMAEYRRQEFRQIIGWVVGVALAIGLRR